MSLSIIVLGGVCVIGLAVATIGIVVMMNSSDRDAVSAAREGWIRGRGGEDE